jgi:hypothetical protein
MGNIIEENFARLELPSGYSYDENGFIKQVEHDHFYYDMEYKIAQSTNVEMSYLRIGWLSASISYDEMQSLDMVDIGSGNGEFGRHCAGRFKSTSDYDLCGDSITRDELMTREWGLIVLSDVLEHYEDIDELFDMKWKYAMISFPETPLFSSFDEMKKWRHFKPNEHLYYMTLEGVVEWAERKESSIEVVNKGCFEDLIRKRWNENITNISTVLLKRK